MNARELAAADQLATVTRTHMASYLAAARKFDAEAATYEEALGGLAVQLMRQQPAGVAGVAAAALLGLVRGEIPA